MSVSPVSQSPASAIAGLYQNQIQDEARQKPAAAPATPLNPPPSAQSDTVHLSSHAKAAVGDVDHDGDNH